MVRTQVQLREEQSVSLRELAAERNISMAELMRIAVDYFLQAEGYRSRREQWERASQAFGRYSQGDNANVSEEHDAYLTDIYAVW